VVIGGRRTILGAVLGSIFIIAMSEALRPVGDLANFIVFAMALFVVLVFRTAFSACSPAAKRPREHGRKKMRISKCRA